VPLKSPRVDYPNLLVALQRLDQCLERSVAAAQIVYGTDAANDPYRGLYINREQVERELAKEPGTPIFQDIWEDGFVEANYPPRFVRLAQAFDLSSFDLALVLIAFAPEIDLRYERIYAYLQDDVTRRRPTVDLALNLLCTSVEEKLNRRSHVTAHAPLIRHQLFHLIPDANQIQPPLLSCYLKLDEHVVNFLLGQNSLDSRLMTYCKLMQPSIALAELPITAQTQQALLELTTQAKSANQSLYFYFRGLRGAGKQQTAAAIAHALNQSLLVADLQQLITAKVDVEPLLKIFLREARLQAAILYLDELDALRSSDHGLLYQQLLTQIMAAKGIIILAGQQPWTATLPGTEKIFAVDFPVLDFAQSRDCWRTHLATIGAGAV
jgi:hypothetical protein